MVTRGFTFTAIGMRMVLDIHTPAFHHAAALHADQFISQLSILCSHMPGETSHLLYTIMSCGITIV